MIGAHFLPEVIWVLFLHHYYVLGLSVCVEMSLLFHSLTNTCFLTEFSCCLGRSSFVSETYKLITSSCLLHEEHWRE